MATKKKQTRSNRTAGKQVAPTEKAAGKNPARKKVALRTNPAKTGAGPKRSEMKTKARGKRTIGGKRAGTFKKVLRKRGRDADVSPFAQVKPIAEPGQQSGDLQGLSNAQGADSESVEELLAEGNAFEAEVVRSVEDAGNADEQEVRTHEVPEDDVPGEYLDKD